MNVGHTSRPIMFQPSTNMYKWRVCCCCLNIPESLTATNNQPYTDRFGLAGSCEVSLNWCLNLLCLNVCDLNQKPRPWPCSESSWLRGSSCGESVISGRVLMPACQLHSALCWRWLRCIWWEGALHLPVQGLCGWWPAHTRTYPCTNAVFCQSYKWFICTAGSWKGFLRLFLRIKPMREKCWKCKGRCVMQRNRFFSSVREKLMVHWCPAYRRIQDKPCK